MKKNGFRRNVQEMWDTLINDTSSKINIDTEKLLHKLIQKKNRRSK